MQDNYNYPGSANYVKKSLDRISAMDNCYPLPKFKTPGSIRRIRRITKDGSIEVEKPSKSVECSHIRDGGAQCGNLVIPPKIYCYHHQGYH